jgi:hypothetical protein
MIDGISKILPLAAQLGYNRLFKRLDVEACRRKAPERAGSGNLYRADPTEY